MSFEDQISGGENKSEKQRRWEELEQSLKGVSDGLNPEIDKKVFDTVVALNAFGLHTCGSCEGHVGAGDHQEEAHTYPWVSLQAANKPTRYVNEESTMRMLLDKHTTVAGKEGQLNEGEIYSRALDELETYPETPEYKNWLAETQGMRSRLQELLNEFYAHREVKPVVKLRLEDNPESFALLSGSHGRRVQEDISSERENALQGLLVRYQEEMSAFTEFLKKKYFEA